ncbi:MAG: hypothetical protein HC770_08880 [Pseudanabaena sp. CRU_2_10]|nr:hypothetical protein [Pseudanabaena sp. CRU_2_10]
MKFLKWFPLLGLIIFPTAALAQYPIIFNHIKDTNLSQGRCVDNAGATMKRAGFTERFEFLRTGAFAVKGRYSAIIRCTADKNVVFFAVAGPDNKTAENLVVRLRNSF